MNLSECMDWATAHGRRTYVHALPGGDRLVILQAVDAWLFGVRLAAQREGGWMPVEMLTRHTGNDAVTAENFRRLPLGAFLADCKQLASKDAARTVAVVGDVQIVDLTRSRLAVWLVDARGAPRRTDLDYAHLADEYVRRVQAGERSPAKSLADELGRSAAVWSNRFFEARTRGVLSQAKRGEVAHLTAKGRQLLERERATETMEA